MVKITGYVTESNGKDGFTIRITEDDVKDEKGKHPEVSKEVKVIIHGLLYPRDNSNGFVKAEGRLKENIVKCMSISEGLKKGDRVVCSVLLVEHDYDKNDSIYYKQNYNRNDIQSYTRSELWLYPSPDSFRRLENDIPQTLKFRKQNYFMDRNKGICENISGNSSYKYNSKWWIKMNPKMLFPAFAWIWLKAKVSNLWKKVKNQTNLNIGLLITTIISILVNIVLALLSIIKS